MNKLNVLNVSDANKFAFIKGNRPTDEKAIKVKKDSISEHGILCPITAVNGEEVIKSNGHLTDLDGNDIADEHAKDYYAVLDGHRLKAYLELGLPLEDLVVIEPLNKKIAIALLIAEMNICTKTWKGSDYMAAPAMAIKETNAAFDFAMELQRRNFPLSTISLWACGNNKLKAKDLVASLKTREMPQCLQEADGWCAKSRKWFEAASEKFTAKFLAKKYLISFIQDGYNVAEDAAAYTLEIEEKLKKLAQWQADKIQNARKTSTQTQEQVILDLLREHL